MLLEFLKERVLLELLKDGVFMVKWLRMVLKINLECLVLLELLVQHMFLKELKWEDIWEVKRLL